MEPHKEEERAFIQKVGVLELVWFNLCAMSGYFSMWDSPPDWAAIWLFGLIGSGVVFIFIGAFIYE